MRRSISKIPYRPSITAALSTSSGGGGRGRGAPSHFQFTVDTPPEDESKNSNRDGASPPPHGHGRGRGIPPSFSSFVNNESNPAAFGRGRGIGFVSPNSFSPRGEESAIQSPQQPNPKMSFLSKYEEAELDSAGSEAPPAPIKSVPSSIFNVLAGAGRGKPGTPPASQPEKPKAVTQQPLPSEQRRSSNEGAAPVQLSEEEKVKKAMGIFSKGHVGGGGTGPEVRAERWGGGRGSGRGGGGRGRGRGMARGRGGRGGYGGRGSRDDRYEDAETEPAEFLGDPAAEEKVAKRLGPEVMSKLSEEFEEMSSRVLPSPMDEALLEAYETNLMIECESEYFMEEFGTSPDIDEKAPIPLRDALEKMKPFLMAYEGIQGQEEWEEIMEETMKRVPLMKSIVDHYAGPDRVTAKQQLGELERVAETLPAGTPASVKRFTDRAVLSLQSNPGWGFDKKCQFMDKLIMEVSQQYK
ncbi:translation initiation factor IF-2-like [Salvia splendens]|uniref:translation initiation factor IF-2-like n=1 Tax=Salvia splendens TaxID=180675 RepID=UPI001C26B856|nr:translation initiation factor IF-2-like [Salvia splendens]